MANSIQNGCGTRAANISHPSRLSHTPPLDCKPWEAKGQWEAISHTLVLTGVEDKTALSTCSGNDSCY